MNCDSLMPSDYDSLRRTLLDHYDRTARPLPWRNEADPYRVLVSEVMLQQTRVETVKGYYGRWLERFPNVDRLAEAEEDEVLKAWEGLGYYRRARNLHRAASIVRDRHAGVVPSDSVSLRALPGVGEYTSGAVASIAFGERVPAVDGNVRRVLARLFNVPEPGPAWLRDVAAELVDPTRPGDWNQALMELGATVCTPRSPDCGECPVRVLCRASAAGTQHERPRKRKSRAVPIRTIVLLVAHADGRVLLTRRPPEGLLAGMWAFPEKVVGQAATLDDGGGVLAEALADHLGMSVLGAEPLAEQRHRFTHLEAHYLPWSVEVAGRGDVSADGAWLDPDRPHRWAVPVAQRRVMESWIQRRTTEPL